MWPQIPIEGLVGEPLAILAHVRDPTPTSTNTHI